MLLLLIALAALLLYTYIKYAKTYWDRRGVEVYKGDFSNTRKAIPEAYNYFKSKKLVGGGLVFFTRSVYMPVDLEVLRSVLLRNFDHFINHNSYVDEKNDPLTAHLFHMRDEKWKGLRAKLTPTFTSGKMKMMFQTMMGCTTQLINVLDKCATIGDPVDVKDVLARFTTDIIGSTAFGIECNSLNDPDNEFRKYGRRTTTINWRRKIPEIVPHKLLNLIGFRKTDPRLEEFFVNLTKNIVDYRESNHVYRKDFVHLMLQLKNRGKVTDDEKIMEGNMTREYLKIPEIAAQLYVFFLAGFETSSTLMSFALLELAQAQDVQDELREEIKNVIKKHGELTYDAIMEMEYLDQVVNETLRLHPPAFVMDRRCNKNFQIPGTDLVIEKGITVLIPIIGIHHDAEIYPEPLKFKPERFSAKNKKARDPMSFLPFGEGPRNCIGSRFGLLQSKVGLATVISNFKVALNNKTQIPIQYDPKSLALGVKGDVWLNITKV